MLLTRTGLLNIIVYIFLTLSFDLRMHFKHWPVHTHASVYFSVGNSLDIYIEDQHIIIRRFTPLYALDILFLRRVEYSTPITKVTGIY